MSPSATHTNLDTLGRAYHALRAHGLVSSKADFSRWYLAKSHSYLRSMQARCRTVPEAVLAMLEWSLQREILNFSFNPHLGQVYAVNLNSAHDCLKRELSAIQQHRKMMLQARTNGPANNNYAGDPPTDGTVQGLAIPMDQISVVSGARRL